MHNLSAPISTVGPATTADARAVAAPVATARATTHVSFSVHPTPADTVVRVHPMSVSTVTGEARQITTIRMNEGRTVVQFSNPTAAFEWLDRCRAGIVDGLGLS